MLKIVFMCSDAIALPALEWLAASGQVRIAGVFTQPDRAVGRGQQIQANAIKRWAATKDIPVFQPAKFSAADQKHLESLRPDLTLVFDASYAVSNQRLNASGRKLDRFEGAGSAFFERVRAAYQEIARNEPGRVRLIDGSAPAEQVKQQIEKIIATL